MSKYQKKRVLILVKTYPTPSTKHVETVCTAGITDNNEWIRLFPILWRDLDDDKRYKIFSWIDVDVKKSPNDHRPESFRVNSDTLKIVGRLDPKRNAIERKQYIDKVAVSSMEEVIAMQQAQGKSLGVFTPKEVTDITVKPISREWSEKEKSKLNQMSLFSAPNKKPLEKIPYEFRIHFVCNDTRCQGHDMMITEYEFMQAYRSYVRNYGSEDKAIAMLRDKYMKYYATDEYQRYLIVGNMHRFQDTFLNIGHVVFKKTSLPHPDQMSIFDLL